jgi:internalin A
MSREQGAGARASIVEAWRDAVHPGDERICSPTYDDEGVGAYFRGRTWEGHEIASLRHHEVALSFFTPEAFAYYLAAYMLAVLDDARAADIIYDGILFHLSPKQLGKRWADRYTARLACLSPGQRAAAIAYLRWCASGSDGSRAELDETIAYLETGHVPASGSPVMRLLELAGASGQDRETLERLMLSSTSVTDADLAALRELPALRELDLGGTEITDAGLAELVSLSELRTLDLSSCRSITAEGLAHVGTLRRLAELKAPNANLDDACLRALAPLQLRRLDLTHGRHITDTGWAALDVSRLERLDLFGVDATDTLLARIGDAGQLRELTVKSISDDGLVALARTPLGKLEVGSLANVTGTGLRALATVATLRELNLGGSIADRWPAGWPALATLTLLDLDLTATCAAGMGELASLRELRIYARWVEPGALGAAARAPCLERITIWCSRTELMLDELAAAGPLQTLSVNDAAVTAAGLAALAHLPALTRLQLAGVTPLDDAALRALAGLNVRELELQDISIDDAGLAVLGACANLHSLRLIRSGASAAGLAAFRSAHPAITVIDL